MPYIPPEDREDVLKHGATSPGQLNFVITKFILGYLDKIGKNYETLNDILGVLEATKQEFYRRIVVPYEIDKIRTNGDVY